MKCPACGYIKRYGTETIKTEVRYRSGAKKGQLQRIDTEQVPLDEFKSPFEKIEIEKGFTFCVREKEEYQRDYTKDVDLWACPICGCVFMKQQGDTSDGA